MTAAFDSAPDGASYLVNGPVLRFVLRILGWSQAEFARRIEVHESTAGRMLAGAPTTAATARRIAEAIPGLTIPEIVWLPGFSPDLPPGAIPGDPRGSIKVEPDPADVREPRGILLVDQTDEVPPA